MNMISKEEASCIFFCKKYTEENAKTCLAKIERMEDVGSTSTTTRLPWPLRVFRERNEDLASRLCL